MLSFQRQNNLRSIGLTVRDFRAVFKGSHIQLLTHSYFGATTIASDGVKFRADSQLHRQQLAFNRLRQMRNASALVTRNFFHVLMPAAGLGVASLSTAWPPHSCHTSGPETRFAGLSRLYLGLTNNCSTRRQGSLLEEALRRLLPHSAQAALPQVPTCAAEMLRSSLVAQQLRLLALHAPLLDTMHRLGVVGDEGNDATRQAESDTAWARGWLPKAKGA